MTRPCAPACCAQRHVALPARPPWTRPTASTFRQMRTKHTFRLPPDLAGKLADYTMRKRVPQALIVETALASFLSPDGSERLEGALGRRLDRLTRQVERLERHVTISNEALALFVRFWLTTTPPLPDTAEPAAQAKGRERYEGYVEALGRRLAKGRTLADEISQDIVPGDRTADEGKDEV
jgi:predicted transcriptional regulator